MKSLAAASSVARLIKLRGNSPQIHPVGPQKRRQLRSLPIVDIALRVRLTRR
jgi:hypothetical protein